MPKPLRTSTLLGYLAETKTMGQQFSYGGHVGAAQAARALAKELDKELERLDPKPKPAPGRPT